MFGYGHHLDMQRQWDKFHLDMQRQWKNLPKCKCGWTYGEGCDAVGKLNKHCWNEECSNSYQVKERLNVKRQHASHNDSDSKIAKKSIKFYFFYCFSFLTTIMINNN
jgi:hypothetical protein